MLWRESASWQIPAFLLRPGGLSLLNRETRENGWFDGRPGGATLPMGFW